MLSFFIAQFDYIFRFHRSALRSKFIFRAGILQSLNFSLDELLVDGSSGPETKVHHGTAYHKRLHCFVRLMCLHMQYSPIAPLFLCGKRTVFVLRRCTPADVRDFEFGFELLSNSCQFVAIHGKSGGASRTAGMHRAGRCSSEAHSPNIRVFGLVLNFGSFLFPVLFLPSRTPKGHTQAVGRMFRIAPTQSLT